MQILVSFKFRLVAGVLPFVKQSEIEHCRSKCRIQVKCATKLLRCSLESRSIGFEVRHSQIIVNFSACPDFAAGDLQIRDCASKVLLQEVKLAHLVTVGGKFCHFAGDQPVSNTGIFRAAHPAERRSEEHTSELQSHSFISYPVF